MNSLEKSRKVFVLKALNTQWKDAIWISSILILQFVHPIVPLIIAGYLIIYLFIKPENIIKAFCMNTLMVLSNPGILVAHPLFSTVKWLLLFFGVLSVLYYYYRIPKAQRRFPGILSFLFMFSLISALLSVFSSSYLSLSLYKLVSFTLFASVALSVFPLCKTNIDWLAWFTTLNIVVVLIGLPLLFHPLGYFRNGRGFQGILNHPQAMGVFLAPVTAMIIVKWFTTRNKLRLMPLLLLFTGLIIATQARTAALAIALAIFITFIFSSNAKKHITSGTAGVSIFVMLVGITAVATVWNRQFERIFSGFISKTDRSGTKDSLLNVDSVLMRTRGGQIEKLKENFSHNPLSGVGFGMDGIHGVSEVEINETLGVPISAPVESGFLPLALVSQVGIIGTIFFLMFLFRYYKGVLQSAEPHVIALGFAPLTVNFGEAIYFAVGGLGLYMWMLFGYTYWHHIVTKTTASK